MATRLENEFDPSRINAPDAAYPAGSLKDETTPGVSDDGTPLASRVGNDWQGFSQSALDKAGVVANGQPDSVSNPQILQAIEQMYNDGDSQLAGGNIWPLSSQESAQDGDALQNDESLIRVGGVLYKIFPIPSNPSTIQPGGIDVINGTLTLDTGLSYIFEFSEEDGSILAFLNENRSDNYLSLQAAIDSYGSGRGLVRLPNGNYTMGGDVNYKIVRFKGNGSDGICRLVFDNPYGFTTDVEDNQAPLLGGVSIVGDEPRTDNGQIGLDFSGQNYIKADDLVIFGTGTGVKIDTGAVIESHYGLFNRVNLSQCYIGIEVDGFNKTQSHSFVGGRTWNCVTGYQNNDGTSDINFFGHQFESDIRARHVKGANSFFAETHMFGCRDESATNPDIQDGHFADIASYWSGYRRPRDYKVNNGVLEYQGINMIHGIRNNCESVAKNMLRNAELLSLDGDDTEFPAWLRPSSSSGYAIYNGPQGRIVGITNPGSLARWDQNGLDIPAGRYTVGFTIDLDEADAAGIQIQFQLRDSTGAVIDESGVGGPNFNDLEFTQIPGVHLGAFVVRRFELKNSYTNATFRMAGNGTLNKRVYFGLPFMVSGYNAEKVQIDTEPYKTIYTNGSTPSNGSAIVGDRAINLASKSSGQPVEWECTTAGLNGSTAVWQVLTNKV